MKTEKGNFKYDDNGKVVWQSSEDGRWSLVNNVPDESKYFKAGIDPYREDSVSERLKTLEKLKSLGNTTLDGRLYKKK